MRKAQIDGFIKEAIKLVGEGDTKLVRENGKIPKEFKGYVASLGTSLMQCGLIPSVALFSDLSSGSKEKEKILNVIYHLLKQDDWPGTLLQKVIAISAGSSEEEKLKEEILDAAIALKLAIRTYEFE